MIKLQLLNKLQDASTASLVLKREAGEQLTYYIISRSVVSTVVCVGRCKGTIAKEIMTFNLSLSPILPLVDKGYNFTIAYDKQGLRFVSEDAKIVITPMYVESQDENAISAIEKLLGLLNAQHSIDSLNHQIENLKQMKAKAFTKYVSVGTMSLGTSGVFEEPHLSEEQQEVLSDFDKQISRLESQKDSLSEINLRPFRTIALAAARNHEVVNMCGDYAIISFANSYMLQKTTCPIQAIQGQLLYTLLQDGNGKGFYRYNDGLVYISGQEEQTVVFIETYLPNIDVDSTIVTRGHTEEQFEANMSDLLKIVGILKSKFPDLTLDLGSGKFFLSNDLGEKVAVTFDVGKPKSVPLLRMQRDPTLNLKVTLSSIKIPSAVQGCLNLFQDKVTIYIKNRKVIFACGSTYLVFGRVSV